MIPKPKYAIGSLVRARWLNGVGQVKKHRWSSTELSWGYTVTFAGTIYAFWEIDLSKAFAPQGEWDQERI